MSNLNSKLGRLKKTYHKFKTSFHRNHGHVIDWMGSRALELEDFRKRSQHLLAATGLAAGLVAGQPVDARVQEQLQALKSSQLDEFIPAVTSEERAAILEKLQSIVQQPAGHLSKEDELYLEQQLSDMLGFEVVAELEKNRLNHSIGIMGGEQHLKRFPTDTLQQHDAYREAGLAPSRGAFGWFTEQGVLTEEAVQREKYYIAVQTLYLSNWNTDHAELKPWYKFRKMIVVNPAEEVAVVVAVGDAGPAEWVKKQFGGSPEVIREGKIWSPKAQGRVMVLFVDDPMDKVPLGPVSLTGQALQTPQALSDALQPSSAGESAVPTKRKETHAS